MSVRTSEEILTSLKEILGEDTSDKALTLIEDITDTMSDLTARHSDGEDWKAKYEANDKEWREKYRDRFFNSPATDPDPEPDPDTEPEEKTRFEQLFKED